MTRDTEPDIIHSPLERTLNGEGHTLQIMIYRSQESEWIVEVEDERGTSTVWDEGFATDAEALAVALQEIEAMGIHRFVTEAAQEAEAALPEMLAKMDRYKASVDRFRDEAATNLNEPLSEEEFSDLDDFLLNGVDSLEGMTLDMLDGYLHAIAIGPETLMPSQWVPAIWGKLDESDDGSMLPPVEDLDEAEHYLGLVLRLFNSIVQGFEYAPPEVEPVWGVRRYDSGEEFEDAEPWTFGFVEGVKLNRPAWQALFDSADGANWYRPIGLLGEDAFSADQDALTRTPAQRAALAQQIRESLVQIHAFWLPYRQAIFERRMAPYRSGPKVGRNDPCPCGSGKKFKKCCGAGPALH